ncbi:MAG: DUF1667 domain-containing protein [Flexilinea sp.]
MVKKFTCIICPNGCEITVDFQNSEIESITGASCKRGREYVHQELTDPKRNIASSILVEDGEFPLASVRLTKPIPKDKIFDVMEIIKRQRVKAPVSIGQIVVTNVSGLDSDVIITKNVAAKQLHK